jgi:serine/threonine protein kinase/tetratricopeptide (TPR) repeat protein
MKTPIDLKPLFQALSPRYRIERELGRGGMATVFLASDSKHNRKVAIKVLQPEVVSAIGHERFHREIEIAARLHHPHIVPLFDSGEAEGLHYYIMPFVEGESLRTRLDRDGQFALDTALRLVSQAADALAYAHECGVVHRDIKPDNILLQHENALVMDFGIARPIGSATEMRMTQVGALMGTPAYMSPEQAMDSDDVDGRSDIYSLACVLFEMVTGVPPFSGGSVEAILVKRFTESPPRISSVADGLPGWLDAAVFRAMAREPKDRYTTMKQFEAALSQPAVETEARDSRAIAVLPFADMSPAGEDEYLSDGISEEVINVLSHVPGLRVVARTSSFALKGKNEDLRLVGEKLNVGIVLEGSVRRAGKRLRVTAQLVNVVDGYQLWSERYDRDLNDVFAIQDDIANAIAAKFTTHPGDDQRPVVQRATANMDAYEFFLKGRALQYKRGHAVTKALPCFKQAVELDPEYGEALAWLADSYRLMGTYGLEPPQSTMPQAKEIAERALRIQPNLDEAYATLADVAMTYDRDEATAFRHWERVLDLNPGHVRARCERALWGLACVLDRKAEALAEVDRASELDPLNAWVASMHALTLGVIGEYEDALRQANRSYDLDPESFIANWILMQACSWNGDPDGAISAAQRALATSGRHAWVLGALAAAYGMVDQRDLADAVFTELRARSQLEYVQPSWIAMAAIGAGKLDEAIGIAEKAVDGRDPIIVTSLGHPSWIPLRAHPRFGDLRRRMGFGDV